MSELVRRLDKKVFYNQSNGGIHMNFPKEAYDKFGSNYIMDIYDNKIVMYPANQLGKM